MPPLFLQQILERLQSVLSPPRAFVPLHEPTLIGNEWQYVKDCLDSGWVSTAGKYVDEFEARLSEYTESQFAIAVVTGTAAVQMCLQMVDVQPDDEVLLPTLTFVATANAVVYLRAIPHFVDSDMKTLGVDPEKLRLYLKDIAALRSGACFNRYSQKRIKTLIAMHTFGHPADLDALQEICEEFHLELIEDATESLGSLYKGKPLGNWGRLSALSFNGNKIVTTGGGGAILTNDPQLAKQTKHLTTTAKMPHRWEYIHDQIGYNYRLPNLNAALGCAQLENILSFLKNKRALAERYQETFSDMAGLQIFKESEFARSNYWLNALILDEAHKSLRDPLLALTNDHAIMTRPAWKLLHTLPMFQNYPKMDLSLTENLAQRLINLPSSANLIGKCLET